jgi:hypothetical protein
MRGCDRPLFCFFCVYLLTGPMWPATSPISPWIDRSIGLLSLVFCWTSNGVFVGLIFC